MKEIVLQVALDLLNEHRALSIAHDSVKADKNCWLEAGTPLIKSEGMKIIRKLKQAFPDKIIVADMKTMDTGALEVEMAAKAGADIVCVLAASDDSTIKDALKSARKYGSKIMVDLIGVKDKVTRSKELEKLGADYLCIHIGIDEQMIGKQSIEILTSIVKKTEIPVAVAGGLNSESVAEIVKAGASIIIVGSAITKAKHVTVAAKQIKKAIIEKKSIKSTLFRKYDKAHLKEAFSMVSTPNISDAMHKQGAMQGIRPVAPGFHMIGRALTIRTIDGDWAKPIEAIDEADKGEMNFPIFCKYIGPNAGEPKGFGEIGAEIKCGGQTVRTGDWIIGDDSGVVMVPQEIAQEIANRSLGVKETENRIREEIKSGGSLGSVLKLKRWEKKVG